MKLLYVFAIMTLSLWTHENIEVHKDATSFTLEITHSPTPPPEGSPVVVTQQPLSGIIDANSPQWATLSRRERMRHVCINNKTTFIAAGATVSASCIAGMIALIVHFTAA